MHENPLFSDYIFIGWMREEEDFKIYYEGLNNNTVSSNKKKEREREKNLFYFYEVSVQIFKLNNTQLLYSCKYSISF